MLSFINQGSKDKLSLEAHVVRQWEHALEQPDSELGLRLLLVNLFGHLHIRVKEEKKKTTVVHFWTFREQIISLGDLCECVLPWFMVNLIYMNNTNG